MSKTATKNSITLKGSAAIIKEYLSKNKTSFLMQTFFSFVFHFLQTTESTLSYFKEVFTQQKTLLVFSNMVSQF